MKQKHFYFTAVVLTIFTLVLQQVSLAYAHEQTKPENEQREDYSRQNDDQHKEEKNQDQENEHEKKHEDTDHENKKRCPQPTEEVTPTEEITPTPTTVVTPTPTPTTVVTPTPTPTTVVTPTPTIVAQVQGQSTTLKQLAPTGYAVSTLALLLEVSGAFILGIITLINLIKRNKPSFEVIRD